jgi:hypothetical protein
MADMTPFLIMVLVVVGVGCTTNSENPTGCVGSEIDAGAANDVVCALGWSCNSNSEHYDLICTTTSNPSQVQCACSSDQDTPTPAPIVQPTFMCSAAEALPVVNTCGKWELQSQM